MDCERCGKELETPARRQEYESFVSADRKFDAGEFTDGTRVDPFCSCCETCGGNQVDMSCTCSCNDCGHPLYACQCLDLREQVIKAFPDLKVKGDLPINQFLDDSPRKVEVEHFMELGPEHAFDHLTWSISQEIKQVLDDYPDKDSALYKEADAACRITLGYLEKLARNYPKGGS